ncbi:MFS transporter [Cohnella sp. AR92]|uniref:MFS transporter n=1 Tax=Cohnella sp. AR92 TaxID=648716 RepID=UPI000F8DD02F|nr:MFS transporter [Cohnella sp. AR92]RUS49032.1 MFS transporter [Cohnella sp. AR92]
MKDRIMMPIWTIGVFIVVMNTTMFNVSMPSIIQDLDITADLGSWVISSYSIGYALSTVLFSRLTDIAPLRRLLAVGLTILGLSSLVGLFANGFEVLLAARILQSAGAGTMAGLGLVMVSRYIPAERRGRSIAMISSGSAMAFGLGPIIGGLVSEYIGWNGLFGITCLVIVLLPILLRLLPRETGRAKPNEKFDGVGAALTVVNATALLLAVTQLSYLWLAVSLVSIAFHVLWLRRGKSGSFINPELFRLKGYKYLMVIGLCLLMLNLGNLFLMPLALSTLFGKSALAVGLFIAPGAILSTLVSRFVGRWIDQYGNLRFLLLGQAVLGAAMLFFALTLDRSPYIVLIGYLFISPSFTASLSSLNNESTQLLPRNLVGSGMGFLQLVQFFGGSLSVAMCGLLLEHQKHVSMAQAFDRVYGVLGFIVLGSLAVTVGYLLFGGGTLRSGEQARKARTLAAAERN